VITGLARKFTKKGDQMAVFVLEDLDSAIEVTVFPRVLMEQGHKLVDDAIVTVKGRIDKRDESRFGFMAQDVTRSSRASTRSSSLPLHLKVPSHALSELKIQQLRRILRDHPGDSMVIPAHRPGQDPPPLRRVLRRPRPRGARAARGARATTPSCSDRARTRFGSTDIIELTLRRPRFDARAVNGAVNPAPSPV
jgi:hypothetical protein